MLVTRRRPTISDWASPYSRSTTAVPTIYTHAIAGAGLGSLLASGRQKWLFWVLVFVLPMTPDLDVFSTARYGSMAGHRGFTHTLAFAIVVGGLVALLSYRYLRVRFMPLCLVQVLVTASHAILDVFTDGGFGLPLLWPLTEYRFGPLGPIHVADADGNRTFRTEVWYVWLPTLGLVAINIAYRTLIPATETTRALAYS